jgi:hypothetical protein
VLCFRQAIDTWDCQVTFLGAVALCEWRSVFLLTFLAWVALKPTSVAVTFGSPEASFRVALEKAPSSLSAGILSLLSPTIVDSFRGCPLCYISSVQRCQIKSPIFCAPFIRCSGSPSDGGRILGSQSQPETGTCPCHYTERAAFS